MSFFLDLDTPSRGFLAKLVFEERGGGVTAGSTVSKPNDFFVNDVVPISLFCLVTTYGSLPSCLSAGNCANSYLGSSSFSEFPGAMGGRGPAGEHVVDQDYTLSHHSLRSCHGEGIFEVIETRGPRETSLSGGVHNSAERTCFDGQLGLAGDVLRQLLGLVELSVSAAGSVERDGDEDIPRVARLRQLLEGVLQVLSQQRLNPKCPVVLVSEDCIPHHPIKKCPGAGARVVGWFHSAITADVRTLDFSPMRLPAAFTKRFGDGADTCLACAAHVTTFGTRWLGAADLAPLGIGTVKKRLFAAIPEYLE